MTPPPAVSIGLPVRNGMPLLLEALQSIAGQSFTDFEAVVVDNASQDGTHAAACDFAARDGRFRVLRNEEDIGAVANFAATLDAARAPLFMWHAHDDRADPDFLATLHGLMATSPQAVLAVGDVVSADGRVGRERRHPFPALSTAPSLRRLQLMFRSHPSWYYGLWRTDFLRETFARIRAAYPHQWAQDNLLLFAAALRPGIVGSRGTTFYQSVRPPAPDRRTRRATEASPELRLALRRDFLAACRAELAQAEGLTPAARAMVAASLPFFADSRCQKMSKIVKGKLRRAARRSPA